MVPTKPLAIFCKSFDSYNSNVLASMLYAFSSISVVMNSIFFFNRLSELLKNVFAVNEPDIVRFDVV